MADLSYGPTGIGWGRGPDGRFVIQVALQMVLPDGRGVQAPMMAFLLTREEETALKAALSGIVLNGSKPEPLL